jgi:hypothetical protein
MLLLLQDKDACWPVYTPIRYFLESFGEGAGAMLRCDGVGVACGLALCCAAFIPPPPTGT